jgi:hypothetical protein
MPGTVQEEVRCTGVDKSSKRKGPARKALSNWCSRPRQRGHDEDGSFEDGGESSDDGNSDIGHGRPTEGIGAYTSERISPWSKSGKRQWPIFPLDHVTCYEYSSSLKSSKTQCSHSLALSSSDSAASSASTFSLLSRCLASSY